MSPKEDNTSPKKDDTSTKEDDTTCTDKIKSAKEDEMFCRIARSSAAIKSQQRGDKELTLSDKTEHLRSIFNTKKLNVLCRFGNYMNLEDLQLFNEPDNYEMQFYVNKFRKLLDPVQKEHIIKNRRYNYLRNILRDSDYFDDRELEKRNPLLYKQYIGQYVNDTEMRKRVFQEGNFSDYLFRNIDRSLNNFRCDLDEAVSQDVENEESSDDSDIENDEDFKKYLGEQIPVDCDERNRLRQEFVCLMENKFLNGDDDFDYNVVDYDDQYDDLCDQDIEDHYFDDEIAS